MFDRSGPHRSHGGRFGGRGLHGGRHGKGPHGRGERLRRRLLTAGDLQLIILALLEEKARHGYEIIKAVEERSQGSYCPSAGMVYPALTYLTDLGYASVEAEGAKKLYSLTDTGRAYVADNQQPIAAAMTGLASLGDRLDKIAEPGPSTEAPPSTETDALAGVYRDLKALLFDATQADLDERARVIGILRRAIAEIESL